jgi:DNA-binding CsgD family transcriptional regulator
MPQLSAGIAMWRSRGGDIEALLQRALEQARGKADDRDRFSVLTAREYDVVKLLAQNVRTRDVAERLGISGGTVKVHLHNIYEKLGLNTRVDLAFLLRDSGLAER